MSATPEGMVELAAAAHADDLAWELAYDRSSVDRFLQDVERERARLQAGIDAAREQLAAIRTDRHASADTVKAELGSLVFAAREELANLEIEHAKVLATIRDAADREAARIVAAADREVEAIRSSIASFTGDPGAAGRPVPADQPALRVAEHVDAG